MVFFFGLVLGFFLVRECPSIRTENAELQVIFVIWVISLATQTGETQMGISLKFALLCRFSGL